MTNEPNPQEGPVVTLAEADYCYGTGTLTIRVVEIGVDPAWIQRLEWVRVAGHEIWPDGTQHPREVMARASVIQRQLFPHLARQQPPGGRPPGAATK